MVKKMNIGEILSDALGYPLHNIKALVIYAIIAIIASIIGGATLIDLIVAFRAKGVASFALGGVGLVGIIVFVLVLFLIEGYGLDIVKYGINRRADSPGIDIGRQISNAIKLIVVDFVYYIVPSIIIFVLGLFLRNWILSIISIILIIIFALANFMARCRLAKTGDLGNALAIGEAIGDISKVGVGKLIATVLLVIIIAVIIVLVIGIIGNFNNTIGAILLGIAMVYLIFFCHRAIGLLYSEV